MKVVACLAFVVVAGCDLSGAGLPCVTNGNCPASLVCAAGMCEAGARDAVGGAVVGVPVPGDDDGPTLGRVVSPPPFSSAPSSLLPPPRTTAGPDVAIVPGAVPRVLVHENGDVDILFAIASCGGVGRWRPLDDSFAVVAEAGKCVDDLDAKLNANDVTFVVARENPDGGPAIVVLFNLDANGNASTPTTISSPSGGERGLFPRIAIAPDGTAKAAWATRGTSVTDIDVAAPLTTPTTLYGSAGGVALAIDSSGVASVFFTDDGADYPGLYVDQGGVDRYIASSIDGAVDAVWCGAALDVLHRKGAEVVVDDVASTTNPSVLPHVDEGLAEARVPGDVAIACDQASPWAAYFVLGDDVVRVKKLDGAQWSAAAPDVPAGGPASLVVVNGTYHLAYSDDADHVVYATNP